MSETESAVAVVEPRSPGVVLPVGDAAAALAAYRRLQKTLDEQMPEAIVEIAGRRFRRRMYWTAIAAAFGIDVELVSIERIVEGEGWGYTAVARATAPNGRHVDGDGACFASEKRSGQRTEHNVRAHAVTRAKNRAVADLCGFGEVSADEIDLEAGAPPARPSTPARTQANSECWPDRPTPDDPTNDGDTLATEKQIRMLKAKSYDRAKALGDFANNSPDLHGAAGSIRKSAVAALGLENTKIPRHAVDALARLIEAAE